MHSLNGTQIGGIANFRTQLLHPQNGLVKISCNICRYTYNK